jgi:hypothetical protein
MEGQQTGGSAAGASGAGDSGTAGVQRGRRTGFLELCA